MFKALDTVQPELDKVDKLTYKRIVPPKKGDNNSSVLERDNMGNAGLGAQPGKGDLDDMLSTIKKHASVRK